VQIGIDRADRGELIEEAYAYLSHRPGSGLRLLYSCGPR
jgi:hypothetical protein